VSSEHIVVPKWLPLAAMHPVDYYSSVAKNCSGVFTEDEVKSIRAFYYAMCAEADAMLGESREAIHPTFGPTWSLTRVFQTRKGGSTSNYRGWLTVAQWRASSEDRRFNPRLHEPMPMCPWARRRIAPVAVAKGVWMLAWWSGGTVAPPISVWMSVSGWMLTSKCEIVLSAQNIRKCYTSRGQLNI